MDSTMLERALGSGIPYITYAIPFFFPLIGAEAAICAAYGLPYYRLHDSISDLACGVADQVVGLFLKTALFAGYLACYAFVTSRGLNLLDVDAYGPAGQWAAAIALFLGVDLAYYWFHRIAHEWNAPWAGHVVHHSSEEYNLTVALRQGALQSVFSWVFYLPLALLGFPPLWFLAVSAFDTLYQFWIHTRVIRRLGPLEWVLNTPSHHRVHHARNPQYLDKNYAGALIVWDRMFGTFEPEVEEPVYGLTAPLNSWNPIWANLHVWSDLWRDTRRAPGWLDGMRVWIATQGWRPPGLPPNPPTPPVDPATAVRYDVRAGRAMTVYVVSQFVLTLSFAVFVLVLVSADGPGDRLVPAVVFILWSLSNVAGLTEGRRWAMPSAVVRVTFVALLVAAWLAGPAALAAGSLSPAGLP